MELADNFQLSYNTSVCSLQHLVAKKEASFGLESDFSVSVIAHLTVQHHMLSKSC